MCEDAPNSLATAFGTNDSNKFSRKSHISGPRLCRMVRLFPHSLGSMLTLDGKDVQPR